ncbi:hypothetical protein EGW08_017955 [Elysia chlorotica]|uniref:Uncharacterized protein n=1 Tax=Elysia chlorotica TaxID=188477 RepID=A0A433SYP6_ELYCH|nr:hypothetical protein EGW08_017955 [Elysia chlorotica]
MKAWSVLALVSVAVTLCSSQSPPANAVDPFIALVREIEGSAFFPALNQTNRILTFEILAAAETANLELLFNKIGYVTILEYLDALPADYQHRFIRYSIEHLKMDSA